MSHELDIAMKLAMDAHYGQTDKNGEPYILHPLRVMTAAIRDRLPLYLQVAAVLHDVIEDTSMTLTDLANSGILQPALEVVDVLTHRQGETYEDYINRVAQRYDATQVKLLDNDDNFSRLHLVKNITERTRLLRRYSEARRTLAMVQCHAASDAAVGKGAE